MTMTNRDELVEDVAAESDDGRRARRGRNRDAVVEAMLELYGEDNLAPSSDEIAHRAGLSPRSLFRYFDDIDDLARAAIDRQLARVLPVTPIDVDAGAPPSERIAALVDQRARVFEFIGNIGHVARMRAHFQPVVANQLIESRAFFRHQIERLMAPELHSMSSKRAATVLAAVDVLCSFEAYNLLRHDQGMSRTRAVGVLSETLATLFGAES
jgi:AcrR family transcriptional regulator